MTIRAVLQKGIIQPIDPIPPGWAEGQELLVEEPVEMETRVQLDNWASDLDAAIASIPEEEHQTFLRALDDIERESKDAVRREWGMP